MATVLLSLLICIYCTISQTVLDVIFSDSTYREYIITVNNDIWLRSGFTGFRNKGEWVSLKLNNTKNVTGQDSLGSYTQLSMIWNNIKNSSDIYETQIRQYRNEGDIVIFTQSFPSGVSMASTNDPNKLISSFPSFLINNKNLGYVKWSGRQIGGNTQIGIFDKNNNISGGIINTGPIALFNGNMSDCIVISALTDHMAASDYLNPKNNTQIQYGLIGNISDIPSGFTISFLITSTKNGGGLNIAMKRWGDIQLKYHTIKYRGNSHSRDFTLNYLGYSTDNGAYYYYHTETNKNYQETMFDIKAYHDDIGLPTKYVLLDSWWYYKGVDGGVKNWTAMKSVFPDGLRSVFQKTKWKIQAHNRQWSLDNVYADNIPPYDNNSNGGNFTFTYCSKSSLPIQAEFWKYLFDINMDWGLIVYEQDHLSTSQDCIYSLTDSIIFGKQWLNEMSIAAKNHDINIQLCMSYPRHLMSSVELETVTQVRASHDYHPGNDQWQIGISAIFTAAIDIAPSKDSYWSMNNPQSGHYPAGTSEPYNRLQSVVLSLSNGPVTFSDRIGYSNITLIMKCCMTQGLLLRPDYSATMIDNYFLYNSTLNVSHSMGENGEIWSTYSQIGENEMYRYLYIFAVNLEMDYDLYPNDIAYQLSDNNVNTQWLAYESNTSSIFTRFNIENPLKLQSGNKWEFQLYTLIPIGNNTNINNNKDIWYLEGEINKWIKVSNQRFKDITRNNDGSIHVTVNGDNDEIVNIGFVNGATFKQQIVSCKIDETQQVIINMPDASCYNFLK